MEKIVSWLFLAKTNRRKNKQNIWTHIIKEWLKLNQEIEYRGHVVKLSTRISLLPSNRTKFRLSNNIYVRNIHTYHGALNIHTCNESFIFALWCVPRITSLSLPRYVVRGDKRADYKPMIYIYIYIYAYREWICIQMMEHWICIQVINMNTCNEDA